MTIIRITLSLLILAVLTACAGNSPEQTNPTLAQTAEATPLPTMTAAVAIETGEVNPEVVVLSKTEAFERHPELLNIYTKAQSKIKGRYGRLSDKAVYDLLVLESGGSAYPLLLVEGLQTLDGKEVGILAYLGSGENVPIQLVSGEFQGLFALMLPLDAQAKRLQPMIVYPVTPDEFRNLSPEQRQALDASFIIPGTMDEVSLGGVEAGRIGLFATPVPLETGPETSVEQSGVDVPTMADIPGFAALSWEEKMATAIEYGLPSFTTIDPEGVEVVIDTLPKEVAGGYDWDWSYRGYTRDNSGQLEVYRVVVGRDHDFSGWYQARAIEVPGFGRLTFEYIPEQMAPLGFDKLIKPADPELWGKVFTSLWGDDQVKQRVEVHDFGIMNSKAAFNEGVTYHTENITRNAGVSLLFVPACDASFLVNFIYSVDGKTKPSVCSKPMPVSGRAVTALYGANYLSKNAEEWAVLYPGLAHSIYYLGYGDLKGMTKLLVDKNPIVDLSKPDKLQDEYDEGLHAAGFSGNEVPELLKRSDIPFVD